LQVFELLSFANDTGAIVLMKPLDYESVNLYNIAVPYCQNILLQTAFSAILPTGRVNLKEGRGGRVYPTVRTFELRCLKSFGKSKVHFKQKLIRLILDCLMSVTFFSLFPHSGQRYYKSKDQHCDQSECNRRS